MNWESLEKEASYAIETGVTLEEFLLSKDMTRAQWYNVKPNGYKWNKKRREAKNSPPSSDGNNCSGDYIPSINQLCHNTVCENEMHDNSGLCLSCTNFVLKHILLLYRKGYTDRILKKYLG